MKDLVWGMAVLAGIAAFSYYFLTTDRPRDEEDWVEYFERNPQGALAAAAEEINLDPGFDKHFILSAFAEPNLTLQMRARLRPGVLERLRPGATDGKLTSIEEAKFSSRVKRFFCKFTEKKIRKLIGAAPVRTKWAYHYADGELIANIRVSDRACGRAPARAAAQSKPSSSAAPKQEALTEERMAAMQSAPEKQAPARTNARPPAELGPFEGQILQVRMNDGTVHQGEHYGTDRSTLFLHVSRGGTGYTSKLALSDIQEIEVVNR